LNRYVRRRRLVLVVWTVAASVVAGGCSGQTSSPAPAPSSSASSSASSSGQSDKPSPTEDLPIDEGGPLTALPTCAPAPPGTEADVEGLLLPDGAVVTEVQDQGQLVSVRAYVEQTPIQVKQFYNDAPGLELFEIEDEIYEAEVLFGGGDFRSYVKAQAQCQQGSLLLVFVGPGDSGDLPSVGGG